MTEYAIKKSSRPDSSFTELVQITRETEKTMFYKLVSPGGTVSRHEQRALKDQIIGRYSTFEQAKTVKDGADAIWEKHQPDITAAQGALARLRDVRRTEWLEFLNPKGP